NRIIHCAKGDGSSPHAGTIHCAPTPISSAFQEFSRHSSYLSGIGPMWQPPPIPTSPYTIKAPGLPREEPAPLPQSGLLEHCSSTRHYNKRVSRPWGVGRSSIHWRTIPVISIPITISPLSTISSILRIMGGIIPPAGG